jgi:DNA primase
VARLISDDIVDRVRQATDIVSIVRETVQLKKSGAGMTGLCPFHREKTPSFHVNPEKQIFKCFGCGVGGDVFSFIMKTDGLGFGEALRLLAERANIQLPQREYDPAEKGEKTRLYEVNAWAAESFHRCLIDRPMGKPALDYLLGRGLTMDTIKHFSIGYAPDMWDAMVKGGARKGYDEDLLARAGLLSSSEQSDRRYDRFRNRVMFPIYDAQDRAIGFGARCLDGSEPKYLNSPETPLFSKGRTLYAIDRAKTALREERKVIIVEGYMDAVMAHQHGVRQTVGVLGTALSRDHVKVLRRFVDEAVLLFDADNAGQSAASRSIDAFAAEELAVRVAVIPDGLDPDEFLEQRGVEAFNALIAAAVDGLTFKLDRVLTALPAGSTSAGVPMARALDDVLATVAQMPNPVARAQEVRKLAARTGLTERAIGERLEALVVQQTQRTRTAPAETLEAPRGRNAEVELLLVLLQYPETLEVVRSGLNLERLENDAVRTLIRRVFTLGETASIGPADLLARTQEPPLRAVVESLVAHEPVRVEDPLRWCREIIDGLEARAQLQHSQEMHRVVVTTTAGAPGDVDDALHARLAAHRESQRKRGKLDLKKEPVAQP